MARIVIVGGGAVDPIDCDDGSNTRTVRENLLGGYGKGILKRDRMLFVKENLEAGEYEYHLTAQGKA